MQAVVAKEFGGPEVMVATVVPDPVAGPDEVVVAVAAVHVLWVETMIRGGRGGDFWGITPPYVPGNGIAGRVESVGPGVDGAWLGRRVVAHTGARGGYAERAVVRADGLARVPDELSLRDAAALVHDGLTACALLEGTRLATGDRVLLVGASGGLGIALLQLARARGARVVALARDERKLARLRELGPDTIIDSEASDWAEQARTALGGAGADVIFDNVGGEMGEATFALIAPHGRFSAHGTPGGRFAEIDRAEADRRGVTLRGIADVQLPEGERRRLGEQTMAAAVAGQLRPVIGQTFPLAQAAAAHAAIESREVFGATLLTIGPVPAE